MDRLETLQRHLVALDLSAETCSAVSSSAESSEDTRRTIAAERQKSAEANILSNDLSIALYGSQEKTNYRREAFKLIERDTELVTSTGQFYDETRPESRKRVMKMIRRWHSLKYTIQDLKLRTAVYDALCVYDRAFAMRIYVHDMLFRETIWAQGTPDQFRKWQPLCDDMHVIGCFAMTELGHSSQLRGLETTATYDRATQEFVINSPTLTASKWWIGMAGQTATHTVAICQLVIDDKPLGLFWYIVPLRCTQTGRLLPGVSAGDIGPKAGRNGLDNGWIQFSHVRVPRENMLMRWSQVSPSGDFNPPISEALSYATLIGERIIVPLGIADAVGQSVTIATRYAAVRRQGPNDEQIIDYPTHYGRLIPVISNTYCFHIVGQKILDDWKETQQRYAPSEQSQDSPIDMNTALQMMEEIQEAHAVSAGVKAWLGWWAADALETCRRLLGGHGYSSFNAIAGQIDDFAVMTQGGGDNMVLALQTARYLLSSWRKALQNKPLAPAVHFLSNAISSSLSISLPVSSFDPLNPIHLLSSLEWVTARSLQALSSESEKNKWSFDQITQNATSELVNSSRTFTYYFMSKQFFQIISREDFGPNKPEAKKLIEKVFLLFCLESVEREIPLFLEFGYFSPDHARSVRRSVAQLCRELRSHAVVLVDAFDLPDFILKSPLGRYDGDVYPAYFELVKNSRNGVGVPSYWASEIAPLVRKPATKQ